MLPPSKLSEMLIRDAANLVVDGVKFLRADAFGAQKKVLNVHFLSTEQIETNLQ